MKKKIFALAAALLMGLVMAGCGGSQDAAQEGVREEVKTLIDVTDDGGLVANFDKTEKGTGGGSGITIDEGEYLIIDSQLTEGKVQVTVTHGGSDIDKAPTENTGTMPTIDYEFEGVGETEYGTIEPGDYMVSVNVTEKATGRINFVKSNKNWEKTETVTQ
ncbi:MAG: hypothetical protein IJL89_08215 [Firmicutes bacterium]|nr:hypothetical protein [Bacillota bacterium]